MIKKGKEKETSIMGKIRKYGYLFLTMIMLFTAIPVSAEEWEDDEDWEEDDWGHGGWGDWGDWGKWEEMLKLSHGTSDVIITEDMLNNTPPADYTVNENTQGEAKDGAYNAYFLEKNVQTVSITVDDNNLNYLLQNANVEPYVMAESVTIGDVTLGYCGLKTKGSYTLEHAYTDNAGSDRFSFTINFGKYIKKADYGVKQNFFGCDRISFNNFFFDKSMLKEFFALKLMDEMGLPTPQYGLAKLYINGNYYGVYAMVEALDESILEQYYGVDGSEISSYLCKPEGTKLQREQIAEDPSPLWEQDEDTYADVEDMLPTVLEWVERLNCLSEGTDFEGNAIDVNSEQYLELLNQIMDVTEVVKYFAVHSFLCQLDNMFVGQKNFGLYVDESGKALVIPWDYDLSFGCYFPSTAEATANYDIDIMYRNNIPSVPERTYMNYPLFYVIYQNEQLMEEYHGYMKECSKVAALGGKVEPTGKTYEPAYFNSYIEAMKEEIFAAAGEKLADNVYYMNGARQPSDVSFAFANLASIMTMRSVGVLVQVDGVETLVSGNGCNLGALGNAMAGRGETKGNITAVNAATGIFVTAEYEGGKLAKAPLLTVKKLEEGSSKYVEIEDAVGGGDEVIIYSIKNAAKPITDYTITIPLTKAQMKNKDDLHFYAYSDGEATEIKMTGEDNLYTGTTASIDYIVIVTESGNLFLWIGVIVGVVLAGAVVFVLWMKKKNTKKSVEA